MNQHPNARLTPHGRSLLVRRIREEGWAVQDAADAGGVSRRTAFKWLSRFAEAGRAGLRDRRSTPRRRPGKTPRKVEQRIARLRRKLVAAFVIARRLGMALSTVFAVLKRLGLSRLKDLQLKEPVVRYEKDRPGEMIHLDVKKLGRIRGYGHRVTGQRQHRSRGIGWDFVHVAVDDHSRAAWADVFDDERAGSAAEALRLAVAWYESLGIRVESILTDNGACYRSREFAEACMELGIQHRFTRPYRPQTNGKAERFIQTMLHGWAYAKPYKTSRGRRQALASWLRYYNERREHGSLGHQPLISRIPSDQ